MLDRERMAVDLDRATATARFATDEEISPFTGIDPQAGDLYIGHTRDGENIVSVKDDRHHMLLSMTRGGKGRTCILPMLQSWAYSAFVLDPKGENATATAIRRGEGNEFVEGMGQKIAVLDPFGEAEVPEHYRAAINPMDFFSEIGNRAADEAAQLADTFMPNDGATGNAKHFNDSARNLIKTVILHVKSSRFIADDERHLGTVRRLIVGGDIEAKKNMIAKALRELESLRVDLEEPEESRYEDLEERVKEAESNLTWAQGIDPFQVLLMSMAKNEAYSGVIQLQAERFKSRNANEFASVCSTAELSTEWLESDEMVDTLSRTTFDLGQLRDQENPLTVYLCLPIGYLETHGGWLRAMLKVTLNTMERKGVQTYGERPALFLLEEMAALGKMEFLRRGAGLLAGYGCKFLYVLQDLSQLQELYGKGWQTFISNSGVIQAFGIIDWETQDYFSKLLGKLEIEREVVSSTSGKSGGTSKNTTIGASEGAAQGFAPGTNFHGEGTLATGSQFIDTGKNSGSSSSESTGSNSGWSEGQTRAPQFTQVNLLNPDEVRKLFSRENNIQLVFLPDGKAAILSRPDFTETEYFRGKWHNPDMPLSTVKELQDWEREGRALKEQKDAYELDLENAQKHRDMLEAALEEAEDKYIQNVTIAVLYLVCFGCLIGLIVSFGFKENLKESIGTPTTVAIILLQFLGAWMFVMTTFVPLFEWDGDYIPASLFKWLSWKKKARDIQHQLPSLNTQFSEAEKRFKDSMDTWQTWQVQRPG